MVDRYIIRKGDGRKLLRDGPAGRRALAAQEAARTRKRNAATRSRSRSPEGSRSPPRRKSIKRRTPLRKLSPSRRKSISASRKKCISKGKWWNMSTRRCNKLSPAKKIALLTKIQRESRATCQRRGGKWNVSTKRCRGGSKTSLKQKISKAGSEIAELEKKETLALVIAKSIIEDPAIPVDVKRDVKEAAVDAKKSIDSEQLAIGYDIVEEAKAAGVPEPVAVEAVKEAAMKKTEELNKASSAAAIPLPPIDEQERLFAASEVPLPRDSQEEVNRLLRSAKRVPFTSRRRPSPKVEKELSSEINKIRASLPREAKADISNQLTAFRTKNVPGVTRLENMFLRSNPDIELRNYVMNLPDLQKNAAMALILKGKLGQSNRPLGDIAKNQLAVNKNLVMNKIRDIKILVEAIENTPVEDENCGKLSDLITSSVPLAESFGYLGRIMFATAFTVDEFKNARDFMNKCAEEFGDLMSTDYENTVKNLDNIIEYRTELANDFSI
ncbi:hypothetical protein OAG24_01045 [bacterium]|nr:hypothetical protein [bacterium]